MTLVNVDPHVILHQKIHVSFTGIFVGICRFPVGLGAQAAGEVFDRGQKCHSTGHVFSGPE